MKQLIVALSLIVPAVALSQDAAATAEPQPSNPKNELAMADLPNNAFTNPGGTFVLHPILPSSWAVMDNLEVKTSLFGLLGGPNLSLEYSILNGPDMAFSIEPAGNSTWGFNSFGASLTARFTMKMGSSYLSAAAAGSYTQIAATTATPAYTAIGAPVTLNWNLQTSPQSIWEVYVTGDAYALATSPIKGGAFGFNWYHSFGSFQLGLGIFVPFGVLPKDITDALKAVGITLPFVFIPLPDLTLGWKF